MKFTLKKASDWKFKQEINIDTFKDLESIYEEYGTDLVVSFNRSEIKIYDDYIE